MKNYFFIAFFFILKLGCEEDYQDNSPPSIYIDSPTDGTTVSEITSIKCIATDNDSVKNVELWIDSSATGLIDSVSPYEFLWDTRSYSDSSIHIMMAVAEDMNNNFSSSDEVRLIVDNTNSNPSLITIESISYSLTNMIITFEKSKDDDFSSYELLRSQTNTSEKNSILNISNINDTIINISDFNPLDSTWYWIKTKDIYGYESIGSGYLVIDIPPSISTLESINFTDSLFILNWSQNQDVDFESYTLNESIFSDMLNPLQIFQGNNSEITFFNRSVVQNQYLYYQIIVRDDWGLQSYSNIKVGCSWYLFNELYGESGFQYGRAMLQTNNGDYIIVGNSSVFGDSFSNAILTKVNYKGEQIWKKDYSFSDTDRLNSFVELENGDLVLVGYSMSSTNSSKDILIIRSDSEGNIIWQHTYGGNEDEVGNSIDITSDNNFIVCGDKIDSNNGKSLCYIMKVNGNGEEYWSDEIGGEQNDHGYSIITTSDGGSAISGMTRSSGNISGDAWILKLNNDGIIEWSKSYGGNGSESGRKIIETNDNCYLIVGSSDSFGSGDNDAYLIKIDSQGNQLWSETYGGGGTDHGRFVMQTVDQGYIISGYSDSIGESNNFDFWLFKVDPLGVIEWQRSYNSDGNDRAFSGMQTLDGGYAIAGYGSLNSTTPPDLKIIKTDDQGLTN